MGLLEYGPGANAFVQAFYGGRNARRAQAEKAQEMEMSRRRLALEEQYKEAMIKNMLWQQQQAQAKAEQEAEDRRLAQEKMAAYQSDLMNAPVMAAMPGLMQSGAVGAGSSDPRALAMAARGQLQGQAMPTAEQVALISMRHGDPKPYMDLATKEKKEPPFVAALRQASANGTISDQGLAILNKIDGGDTPLYQRKPDKPDTKETWGEPTEMNIGGKKALVQKSSHGQIKPVLQDVSTTIINHTDAIKSGVEEEKKRTKYVADTARLEETISGLSRLGGFAKQLREHKGLAGITGLRGIVPNIPGSNAANAYALLNTIKSQVAANVLQTMRNNSKTGGALGQVSERELDLLENNLAALDQAQDYKSFKNALKAIEDFANGASNRANAAYNSMWGEAVKQPESGNSKPKRMTYNPATGRIE